MYQEYYITVYISYYRKICSIPPSITIVIPNSSLFII